MTTQFIQDVDVIWAIRDGKMVATEQAPGIWVLAHRGYSGSGRLDLWAHPTEEDAWRAGAEMALSMVGDRQAAQRMLDAGQYPKLLATYEQESPDSHLLRVVPALLTQPNRDT